LGGGGRGTKQKEKNVDCGKKKVSRSQEGAESPTKWWDKLPDDSGQRTVIVRENWDLGGGKTNVGNAEK